MEVKERVIDVRQYFIYLWENKIIVILVILLFTGGMVGYSYQKQMKIIEPSESQKTRTLNEIISQNHDAYYKLNNVDAYTDADQPAGTYNCSVRLFVDFNYSIIEGNNNIDYSQMTSKIQQDAIALLVSDKAINTIISELDLNGYDDMNGLTPNDIKWMVNRNFLGANILQIVITDVDSERAEKIAQAVADEFIKNSQYMDTIDNVRVIDEVSTPVAGNSFNIQTNIIKKSILKDAILGFIGGTALIAVIYLLLFIFMDAVRDELDAAFADLKVFGKVSRKEIKRDEDCKRIANNISFLQDCSNLVIIPVDKKSEDEGLIDAITDNLKDVDKNKTIVKAGNVKDNADATMKAKDGQAVLLVAKYGKTRKSDLLFAKSELEKTAVPILGVIIDQCT